MSEPPFKKMKTETPFKKVKKQHDRRAKGGVPQANPFVEWLQKTTVGEVCDDRKVVLLKSTDTINDGMKTLGRFKILSAPVIDSVTNELQGFVDVKDMGCCAVNIYIDGKVRLTPTNQGKKVSELVMVRMVAPYSEAVFKSLSKSFLDTQVGDILDLSANDPSCSVAALAPVFQCIGLFQKGINRVTVLGPDGKAMNVLSQSDIIRILVGRLSEFPQLFNKTLNELGLSRKRNLVKIRQTEPAIKALALIVEHKISGVAVVDDEGTLVGNFSASDLKGNGIADYGVGSHPFLSLQKPVMEFLQQGGMSMFPVGTCQSDQPFHYILLKLMALRLHRLWVVTPEKKPIGVITLTDVMQALIREKQEERKD